ncbi:MAG: pyrroline-5-carboxylate reductase [Chloroflexi bacterium]|nr:pyrroline-5-carboxylate reductase [Chloroflexota bacterium]
MPLQNLKIAFVGSGVMGEAMIKGLLNKNLVQSNQLFASDPHIERGKQLIARYALTFTAHNDDVVKNADIVVLSVKPQVMNKALADIRGHLREDVLVLSIAAGVKIKKMRAGCGAKAIVRSMPNTPGQIGEGITVWTATPEVTGEQRQRATAVLGALGETLFVEDEHYLDMATALNGSGPAYIFLFMEALIDAGVHLGFSRQDAERLVLQTMKGSVEYALHSGLHPAQLRNQVTSPGGTSAEALYFFEKGGLRNVVSRAVWAAYKRSVALGSGGSEDED